MAALKHRRTALERVEKFLSETYFTDCNLRGRWAAGQLAPSPLWAFPGALAAGGEGRAASGPTPVCVRRRPRRGGSSPRVAAGWGSGGSVSKANAHRRPGQRGVLPQGAAGTVASALQLSGDVLLEGWLQQPPSTGLIITVLFS